MTSSGLLPHMQRQLLSLLCNMKKVGESEIKGKVKGGKMIIKQEKQSYQ
jgi:hypothetical protein